MYGFIAAIRYYVTACRVSFPRLNKGNKHWTRTKLVLEQRATRRRRPFLWTTKKTEERRRNKRTPSDPQQTDNRIELTGNWARAEWNKHSQQPVRTEQQQLTNHTICTLLFLPVLVAGAFDEGAEEHLIKRAGDNLASLFHLLTYKLNLEGKIWKLSQILNFYRLGNCGDCVDCQVRMWSGAATYSLISSIVSIIKKALWIVICMQSTH